MNNLKQLMSDYNRLYTRTDLFSNTPYGFYKWIIKILPIKNKVRILDVACGRGYLLKAGNERNLDIVGIDFSKEATKLTKQSNPNLRIALADGHNLPFQDETFDIVTNLGSLEHFLQIEVAIKETVRVLKRDGTVCFMLPNSFYYRYIIWVLRTGDTPGQGQLLERFATFASWNRLIEKCGLKVYKIRKFNGYSLNAWKRLVKDFLIPRNLSYHFIYYCRKNE